MSEANYPKCKARGIVIETEGGPRVTMGGLFGSFTRSEKSRWFLCSRPIKADEFGIDPEGVEAFFEYSDKIEFILHGNQKKPA